MAVVADVFGGDFRIILAQNTCCSSVGLYVNINLKKVLFRGKFAVNATFYE